MSAILESDFPTRLHPREEEKRLTELRSLNLLDTPPEERFDRVTRLASEFFGVPIAYVGFIESERQWYKSRVGFDLEETTRDISFCRYTIVSGEPLIIPDARAHPIGRDHPMVTGEPYLRFYAGVPLRGPTGRKIGTFCLLDLKARDFTMEQVAQMQAFASIVEREMNLGEMIQAQADLLSTRQELVETQAKLRTEFEEAARYVRKMLPPPLEGREILDSQFHPSTELGGDGFGYRPIDDDRLAVYILDVTGHGLGSTLLAVTALEYLRSRVQRPIDFGQPAAVIAGLNRTFQMKDHDGKFFSAWYGVYSRSARTLTYANAGHPPAVLMTRDGRGLTLERTAPGASVLGILPEIEVPVTTVPFGPETELLLFTDGLYELADPKKAGRGSYDEFFAYLASRAKAGMAGWEAMLEWLEHARHRGTLDDDVTLLRFAAPKR